MVKNQALNDTVWSEIWNGIFTARDSLLLHKNYMKNVSNFCKYHASTPENLARREKERAELEKENARKSSNLHYQPCS